MAGGRMAGGNDTQILKNLKFINISEYLSGKCDFS
jgi:hypothetical protein